MDIFSGLRLKGKDKVEEKETTQEILISKTTEKALPSNFDKEVVNLYFEEEEIELDDSSLSDLGASQEVTLNEDGEIQPEQTALTKKVHTILYVRKVFDHFSFSEKELTEILVKSANYNTVKFWDIEQIDWVVELGRMNMEGIFSVLIPPMWLRELPYELPKNFERRIERGELRIISFNKKKLIRR